MAEINILPADVVSKIAAGEVIERPASVLKELLENSVDAGARHIDIELEKAGRRLIRVRDDGKGIAQEDMRTALLRHSTSKLKSFEDIYSLETFGFRGEALYSIFAVSRMKIVSCRGESENGTILEGEGGVVTSEKPAPPVKGTVIEVSDLFFNIPARAKFLKSDASERAHLIKTAEEAALAGCGTSFRLKIDGVEIFSVPLLPGGEDENLRHRTETVLGRKVFSGMRKTEFKSAGITVRGYISEMNMFGASRSNQYYFVNRRPVSSQLLKQALYKAYPVVPAGKHPACVLFIDLDPAEFDVNVHPQKRDVKFSREGDIFTAVGEAVRHVIENRAVLDNAVAGTGGSEETRTWNTGNQSGADNIADRLPPGGVYGRGLPPAFQAGYADYSMEPRSPSALPETTRTDMVSALSRRGVGMEIAGETNTPENDVSDNSRHKSSAGCSVQESESIMSQPGNMPMDPELIPGVFRGTHNVPPDPASAWKTADLKYIGQLASSYLLFECARGLLIVDQHAAQERVFFEKYLDELADNKISRQPLLVPVEAELSRSQVESVMRWKDWLDGAGFEIDARGPDTVVLRCAPALFDFGQKSFTGFVSYLADIMGNPSRVTEDVKRNVIATMACKKAIKARDYVNPAAAMEIMDSLRKCRDGAHCPHGRPVIFYMPGLEIAKKFARNSIL